MTTSAHAGLAGTSTHTHCDGGGVSSCAPPSTAAAAWLLDATWAPALDGAGVDDEESLACEDGGGADEDTGPSEKLDDGKPAEELPGSEDDGATGDDDDWTKADDAEPANDDELATKSDDDAGMDESNADELARGALTPRSELPGRNRARLYGSVRFPRRCHEMHSIHGLRTKEVTVASKTTPTAVDERAQAC